MIGLLQMPYVSIECMVSQTWATPAEMARSRWRYVNRVIAAEISAFTRYYDRIIQAERLEHDSGLLLSLIDCPSKSEVAPGEELPDLSVEPQKRTAILLNGLFNHHLDIQGLLLAMKSRLARTSRPVVVAYNPYWSWLYRLANRLGLRSGAEPTTFVTETDLRNLVLLSGYEIARIRPAVFFPWKCLGVGVLLNRLLPAIPLLRALGLVNVVVIRPVIPEAGKRPSLSVVIPARNEKGNIENALKRMPDLDTDIEVIFVEGNSSDGTWEEIQRIVAEYSSRFKLKAFRQTGKGKNDAVRLGFAKASGEVLTILDADLTMPPELLGRFFDAYCEGKGDFINGTRLVYPMEGEAMRFLNRLGNIFFAKALSAVLSTRLGDSLCGTKLLSRHDYERIVRWRADFGDFDPFGDFDLLFPAADLGFGIIDIPIRYRARTYGATNIHRFRHGFLLLRMTLVGLLRIKMGRI